MVNVPHCRNKQHIIQKTPANQSNKAVLDEDKSRRVLDLFYCWSTICCVTRVRLRKQQEKYFAPGYSIIICVLHSSFPVIHKVDDVNIFLQLLMEINWKQLRAESISMQANIYQDALNSYWSDWFLYFYLFSKISNTQMPMLPTLYITGKLNLNLKLFGG